MNLWLSGYVAGTRTVQSSRCHLGWAQGKGVAKLSVRQLRKYFIAGDFRAGVEAAYLDALGC